MYMDTVIAIPLRNPKITVKKGVYVMYETGRRYVKEKRYTVPKRVCVGKVCEDDKNMMRPKDNITVSYTHLTLPTKA